MNHTWLTSIQGIYTTTWLFILCTDICTMLILICIIIGYHDYCKWEIFYTLCTGHHWLLYANFLLKIALLFGYVYGAYGLFCVEFSNWVYCLFEVLWWILFSVYDSDMTLLINDMHVLWYQMNANWSVLLGCTSFVNPGYLVIKMWVAIVTQQPYSMPMNWLQMYISTEFFPGLLGYILQGVACPCIVTIVSLSIL